MMAPANNLSCPDQTQNDHTSELQMTSGPPVLSSKPQKPQALVKQGKGYMAQHYSNMLLHTIHLLYTSDRMH
jgi:hypothetical protein